MDTVVDRSRLAALRSRVVGWAARQYLAWRSRRGLDPVTRLRVVADAYGLAAEQRLELLDVLGERFANGGTFVRRRIEAGEQARAE